jgi:hypothetical protein
MTQASQAPTNPDWSTLLLGWCAGLWSVWVVLNLFPFGQTNLTMTLVVAGAAALLLLAGLLLHGPRDTPSLACAMVFVCLVPWSTWLVHRGLPSEAGLLAGAAALAAWLLYGLRLSGLQRLASGAILKRPHVLPWLFWAALLEGLWLMMPITAVLPQDEALGTVLVVGFLWMLASALGALAGHRAHENSLPEAKGPPLIFGVCLVPWAMGAASLVLGMALGQHTGHWVAWGYVAASLVSAASAFVSRQRILNLVLQRAPVKAPPAESTSMTPPPHPGKPLPVLQATFANMLSRFGHQLPDDDVLHRRRGRIGDDDDGDYGRGDVVTYLFGQNERGEYLDFYMRHRVAGDQHIRIYEDGTSERLEVISPFSRGSDDPVENERLRREDREEYDRIRAMLDAKGFPSSY